MQMILVLRARPSSMLRTELMEIFFFSSKSESISSMMSIPFLGMVETSFLKISSPMIEENEIMKTLRSYLLAMALMKLVLPLPGGPWKR